MDYSNIDYYTQACCVIDDLSNADADWLEQHYAGLQRVIYDHNPDDLDRSAYQRVLSVWWADAFMPTDLNFTVEVDDSSASAIIAGEEYANHQLMACLVQAFIKERRPEGHRLIVEYAYTSDDPGRGHYGGGAWVCDGMNMLHSDSRKWLESLCS